MGLWSAFTNKSGKSQKTSKANGNKYITETKKTKNGSTTTYKPVKTRSK